MVSSFKNLYIRSSKTKTIIMKKIFLSIILLGFLFSCESPKTVDVVEKYYQDGTAKTIITYEISAKDSTAVSELQLHPNGAKKMEGAIVNGRREGEWISWHPDGSVWSTGRFEKGKREGESLIYYPNGQLYMKGSYLHGRKSGKWTVWDENGEVLTKNEF